jgi:hypothetical protein
MVEARGGGLLATRPNAREFRDLKPITSQVSFTHDEAKLPRSRRLRAEVQGIINMGIKLGAKTSPYIDIMVAGATKFDEPLTEAHVDRSRANAEHYRAMLEHLGDPPRKGVRRGG